MRKHTFEEVGFPQNEDFCFGEFQRSLFCGNMFWKKNAFPQNEERLIEDF